MRTSVLLLVLTSLTVAPSSGAIQADGWSRFRGPNGTGVTETGALPSALDPEKTLRWRTPLPAGHSSPILWNRHVYVTAEGDGEDSEKLLVVCLSVDTGEVLWQREAPRDRVTKIDGRNNPASPSPVASEHGVVVFFPDFGLTAYDHEGAERWRHALGPFDNLYGMGASPILSGGKVILACDQNLGSYVIALSEEDGSVLWRTERPMAKSGHCTPVVRRTLASNELLLPGSFTLDAYDLQSGERTWWFSGLSFEMKSVPVLAGDTVFINGYGSPMNQVGNQIDVPPFDEVAAESDSDGDGKISSEEMPPSRAKAWFDFVDLNHDGGLDQDEWGFLRAALRSTNGLLAFRPGGQGDITEQALLWDYRRAVPQLPTPVFYEDVLYMLDDGGGILTTFDPGSGEVIERGRLPDAVDTYYASPIASDGKVFLVSEHGIVSVLRAGGKLEPLSTVDLEENCYATPAIAFGRVILRTTEALYCFEEQEDDDPAELVLMGGTLWTLDETQPRAEALAVRGERIVAVGSDEEVRALVGPDTRVIQLEGQLVLPGFVDNHVHFASAARFLEFNIMNVGDQEELRRRTLDVVRRLGPGEWILGGFWGAYDQWAEGSAGGDEKSRYTPDLTAIEEVLGDHPLFLRRFDNSQFLVNAPALRAANLDPADPEAEGVEFERGADGKPTGICSGPGARELFENAAPQSLSHERRLAQTRYALKEAARRGVTTFSDMSDDEQLDIYRELHERGELTCRVHYRYPLERWPELAERGIRVGSGDDWIRLGSLKGHIDGIMGTSSARFFEPYSNDGENRGRWRRLMVDTKGDFVEGQFLQYMLAADAAGLQLTVHAIGDEANQLLLDYLEVLNRENGPRDRRFRLVHAQVMLEEDFARLGELGVVAEVQPFHLSDDMRWMEERIGHERCTGAYAFRDILEGGAVLCFGTDWPGTSASEYPIDPMLGLYAAVTRQTRAGDPEEGWFPDQRISIEEALAAYTMGSAYANFEEDVKGSLTVGKLADVVVLSKNLLEIPTQQYLETEVLMTVVGGRVVFER